WMIQGTNSANALQAGLVNLTGDNSGFGGELIINRAVLFGAESTRIGTGPIRIQDCGSLNVNGAIPNPIAIENGAGWHQDFGFDLVIGAIWMGGGDNSFTGNLQLNQSIGVVNGDATGANSTLGSMDSGTSTFSGVISGIGEFSMSRFSALNGGSVDIDISGTASNTYSGKTVVNGQRSGASLRLMKKFGAVAIPGGNTVQLGNVTEGQANLRMGDTTVTGATRNQWNDQFGTANGGVVLNFVNTPGQWMRFDLQGTQQSVAGLNAGDASTQGGAIVQNQNLQDFDPGQDATLTLIGDGSYLYNGWLRDQDDGGTTRKLHLVKSGSGTQTLAGSAITHTGTTTVNSGTLLMNGSLGNSATTVTAGGILGGTGSTAGPVSNHGTLAPGSNAVGNLTVNNTVTLAGGSKIAWQISNWTGVAGSAWDKLTTNSLNITATSANRITLKLTDHTVANFSETNQSFVLIQTTSGITGFSADKFVVDDSDIIRPQGTWAVQQSVNDLVLVYTGYTGPNIAPEFTADPLTASATEDAAISGSITATDANAGDTLTYTKLTGPGWLNVASDGALSGTPVNSNVGVNTFTVRVMDSTGAIDEAVLQVTVANVNDAPGFTVDPITLTVGEGEAITGQLAATDVDAGDTLTFSKAIGPAWLNVAANGALSGISGSAGADVFTVRVHDAAGAFADATLNITVVSYDGVWINTAGGSWSTGTHWSGGHVAGGTGKTADFSTLDLAANATVTLDSSLTIGNMTFGDTTPSHHWTLSSGSGGALALDVATGTPTITVNNQTTTLN
ncbi:MAG TPA: putative Ig domain-containing protein, partial [Luteolibacter sp.]